MHIAVRIVALLLLLLAANPALAVKPDSEPRLQVRMIVTQSYVPREGMPVYEDLARYLSEKTGWDVSVLSGLSYDETDALLDSGKAQVGFICGLPYTHKVAQGKVDLVAMPVLGMKKGTFPDARGYEGKPGKYYSYTIVRKDSPIKSWEELRGKTYAFNTLTSNSGYSLPRARLVDLGMTSWEQYFSRVIRSGGHPESIRLVAQGIVDASSVESLVLDYARLHGNPDALNVRIIAHLPEDGAGAPPVVVSRKADPGIRPRLQKVLVEMKDDPSGSEILARAALERFMAPDDANYNDIRLIEKKAIDAKFRDFQGP